MEDDHYAVMGAIIEFSKAEMAGCLVEDPINVPIENYKWSLTLPFLNDISEDMQQLLCQKFKIRFI